MKTLRYIFTLALSLSLVGCYDNSGDDALIAEFDHTASGMILLEQSTKAIAGASGLLIEALNLTEYLIAPDEESRLALEYRYYPYRKVREEVTNYWNIYDSQSKDQYYFYDGVLLNEDGARCKVMKHTKFLYRDTETERNRPIIEHLGGERYKVTMRESVLPYFSLKIGSFASYLRSWSSNAASKVPVSLELIIETNNRAFRNGEAEHLEFTITGNGRLTDFVNSDYRVTFEIIDPLTLTFGDNALVTTDCAGEGAMAISNGQVDVSVNMNYNIIALLLSATDNPNVRYSGYYDWTGAHIVP
jgi:hypothetical protein